MHTERAAGRRRADPTGMVEQLRAESVQDVRIEHGAGPLAHGARHHKHGVPAPLVTWVGLSRLLGGCSALGCLEAAHRRLGGLDGISVLDGIVEEGGDGLVLVRTVSSSGPRGFAR
jgi:hypothetical protein